MDGHYLCRCEWIELSLQDPRLALSIAICAIGETVFYMAQLNKNSSPNWRRGVIGETLRQIGETLYLPLLLMSLAIHNCFIQHPTLLKLRKRSHIQLTQITSRRNVTRWVNNRSLIPSLSQAHRQ